MADRSNGPGRPSSRERILDAAEHLAREKGPGNLSLDAVAARAGLSKGGLLYHFPTKAKLLEALVELHVSRADFALREALDERGDEPNPAACAYLDLVRGKLTDAEQSFSGVIAAIAENPDFIGPIRRHQRELVDLLKLRSRDPDLAMIAFLAVEGMRSLQLFESRCLTVGEFEQVLARLDAELMHADG